MPDIYRSKTSIFRFIRRVISLSAVASIVLIGAGCQSFNTTDGDINQPTASKKVSNDAFTLGLENTPSWVNDVDTQVD